MKRSNGRWFLSIVAMEHAGIKVDRAILSRLSSTFAQRAVRLEEEINGLVGHKFNLGSRSNSANSCSTI